MAVSTERGLGMERVAMDQEAEERGDLACDGTWAVLGGKQVTFWRVAGGETGTPHKLQTGDSHQGLFVK